MKPFLLLPIALGVVLFSGGCASTPPAELPKGPVVTGAEILWHGTYIPAESQRIPDPSSPSGYRFEFGLPQLVRLSDQVGAKLGTSFGIIYRIEGTPIGAPVDITDITVFPAGGIATPLSHRIIHDYRRVKHLEIGEQSMTGYRFELPSELKTGTWRMQVWHDHTLLAEQVFSVEPPQDTILP